MFLKALNVANRVAAHHQHPTSSSTAVAVAAAAGATHAAVRPAAQLQPCQLQTTLWPSQSRHIYVQRLVCRAGAVPPPPPPQVFEPHVDTSVLSAQLLVLSLTIGAAAYWWWVVVPTARRTLAKEKRSGQLNEYLQELQHNPDRKVERWFYTDWLQQLQRRQQLAVQAARKRKAAVEAIAPQSSAATNAAIGSLGSATDQESRPTSTGATGDVQQHIEDEAPSFWSLDNPILATTSLVGGAVLVSTVVHGWQ